MKIDLAGNKIELLSSKAIFIEESKTLVVSDLHLGKSSHFQRNGIAITNEIDEGDIDKLKKIVEQKNPDQVIILGDLFHAGKSVSEFKLKDLLQSDTFKRTHLVLVEGNHDKFERKFYSSLGFNLITKEYETIEDLVFTHYPQDQSNIDTGKINISGHIHPGYKLKIGPKSYKKFPCFWRKDNQLVMPAYGKLTGNYTIRPKPGNTLYLIEDNLIESIKIQ
jgi:DNA ligase-associated metallophosphoesterase